MKKYVIYIAATVLAALTSCTTDVLDKKNLSAIDNSIVWGDPKAAYGYLNEIYAKMMPGNYYGNGNGTDEGVPYQKQTNNWLRGVITLDDFRGANPFSAYANIRIINLMMAQLQTATFDQKNKDYMKGQCLFFRAWAYHGMVKNVGGVPLILEFQKPTSNLDELQVERSKTSDCVKQIIKDLDDAIALLPDSWSGEDLGRIDKGAAMAFKGRVLLFYASPLFNGLGGVASWQNAYKANKEAKDFLVSKGKGLYKPYSKIWDDELNKEFVMFRRFSYPQAAYFQGGLIPLDFSRGDVGSDRPSLELVNSFPMKDGSAWNTATMNYGQLFMNRDERFYANIYYNGSPNQYVKGMRDKKTYLWTYFDSGLKDSDSGITGVHNSVTPDALWSNSSFYRIKGVDKNVDAGDVYNCTVDGIAIRYTEVLMNFGECANETNHTEEALQVLKDVRERAGITSNADGKFGITAVSQPEFREAYKKERFVEFCFEGFRWDDLRRWKMFDYLRALPQRHGLGIQLKPGQNGAKGDPTADINQIWDQFTYQVFAQDNADIKIKDQYYIWAIPVETMQRNPKLLQNKDWGGTFDPLQ